MHRLSNETYCFAANVKNYVVVVLCFVLVLTDSVVSGLYTNQLAVHVEGGPDVAHRIAKRHGFINLGQVNIQLNVVVK